MPLIRKDRAGNDSFGHSWPEDGAVVEMPHEEAEELLAIPDGGFTLVLPDADAAPEPDNAAADSPESNPEFSEIDPAVPAAEPEAKPAAKKTAARKTAERKPQE
ncbi:hypothetical protein ACFXI6_14130 [Streptomyces mirabilis]|uniref:hypothetical protein n=1 Tax=Streptomyces mirabilis TaxID=68239 RepID=UPI0036745A0F